MSIYKKTSGLSYEIFVVDNGSSDGSCVMVQSEFPEVNLIRNCENRGFAAANNQAIRQSAGRYVLLLNPDTLVMPNTIDIMVKAMNVRPDVAVAGCKILNANGSLQHSCYRFYTALDLFWQATYLDRLLPPNPVTGRYRMLHWNHNEVRDDIDRLLGAFFMIRHEALEQIGLLDENFFWAQEEEEWCYRAKQQGWKVLFYPDVAIVHYGGASARQRRADTIILGFVGRDYFFRKYYSNRYSVYWILSFFEVLTRLVVWRMLILLPHWRSQAGIQLTAYRALWQYLVLPRQFAKNWAFRLGINLKAIYGGGND